MRCDYRDAAEPTRRGTDGDLSQVETQVHALFV